MKVSIDIIELYFRDYVVKRHILDNAEVCLEKAAFLDISEPVSKDTIYVCNNTTIDNPDLLLPDGCHLVFAEPLSQEMESHLESMNYFVTAGLTVAKLFNRLIDLYYNYLSYEKQFAELRENRASYQDVIDLGTQVVGMPMCIINLNYQPLAISKTDVPDDKLFEAMQQGYGLAYYDLIQRCEFKTEVMAQKGISQLNLWSEAAGNYICVNILYLCGRAVASIGMHKWYDRKNPFEKATMQLFNYFVARLTEHIDAVRNISESRYTPSDLLLSDLLDGKEIDDDTLHLILEQSHLQEEGPFHLLVFLPEKRGYRTELLLDYVETIERLQPNLHCCIFDGIIVALKVQNPNRDNTITEELVQYLKSINYCGICSLEYDKLQVTQKAYRTLQIMDKEILPARKVGYIVYTHDYLIEYALTVLSKHMDMTKLTHPALLKLEKHDQNGKGDLCGVLREYLYNQCSLKATASSLFLHRNTLASRLANIEEIIDLDLRDPEVYKQLMFAYWIRDYYKKRKKQNQ